MVIYEVRLFACAASCFTISETDHVRLEPSEGEHQRSNKTSQLQLQQIRSYNPTHLTSYTLQSYILQSYTSYSSHVPAASVHY